MLLPVLLGPLGLAALTGIALAGTVLLVNNWLKGRRDEFAEELDAKVKSVLEQDPTEPLTPEGAATLGQAIAEDARNAQLAGLPEEQRIIAEENARLARERLGAQALEPDEGINALQTGDRIKRILEGDMTGVNELVTYLQGRGYEGQEEISDAIRQMAMDYIFSQQDNNNMMENLDRFEDIIDSVSPSMLGGQDIYSGRGSMVEQPGARSEATRDAIFSRIEYLDQDGNGIADNPSNQTEFSGLIENPIRLPIPSGVPDISIRTLPSNQTEFSGLIENPIRLPIPSGVPDISIRTLPSISPGDLELATSGAGTNVVITYVNNAPVTIAPVDASNVSTSTGGSSVVVMAGNGENPTSLPGGAN
jgi:hypothetical protein